MKSKETKRTDQEKQRRVTRLDDDQIGSVTGGLSDIGLDISFEANPFGGVARTKTYTIDEKVRKNG